MNGSEKESLVCRLLIAVHHPNRDSAMADLITRTKLCESIPVAMLGAWMMSVCLAICNFMSDGCVVMAGIG